MIRNIFIVIAVSAFVAKFTIMAAVHSQSTCGVSKAPAERIIHGQEFQRGLYPWIVALLYTRTKPHTFFCGGTLISETFVITAAHCIRGKKTPEALAFYDIIVVFGAHDLSNPYEPGRLMQSPRRIYINEEWDPSNGKYDADLSLLEFWENKIHFSDFIQPICLWISENEPLVTEGIVTGWGKSEDPTRLSENEPKSVEALIQSNEDCFLDAKDLVDLSSRRTFCAGLRNGSGVCTGDSGGGLFIKVDGAYHLKGIVSSSLMTKDGSCNVLENAVYTNVLKFKNWIENVTKLGVDIGRVELPKTVKPDNTGPKVEAGIKARNYCGVESSYRSLLLDKVIGGRDSTVGEFPHQGAIGWRNFDGDIVFKCGGELISNRFVLTAAHCVNRHPQPSFVRLGRTDLVLIRPLNETFDNGEALDAEIKTILKHPEYVSTSKYNDIALLELKNDVVFTEYIMPVCLQFENDLDEVNRKLIITGWGYTDRERTKKSDWLQTSETWEISNKDCREQYGTFGRQLASSMRDNVRPTQLCVQNSEIVACQGDSGSALSYLDTSSQRYYAVGILTAGSFCGSQIPGLYTRVSQYVDWIENIVWPGNNNEV